MDSCFLFVLDLALGLLEVGLQYGHAVLDGVVEDVLDLQLVLVVGVDLAQVAELLGLVEAPLQVLGGDKVLGHLNAVVDVADLVKR